MHTCLQIIQRNEIEGGLMDMDNESDDDESVVEDDITCKHDLVNGKVVVCCRFVVNCDEILDIIHKCIHVYKLYNVMILRVVSWIWIMNLMTMNPL